MHQPMYRKFSQILLILLFAFSTAMVTSGCSKDAEKAEQAAKKEEQKKESQAPSKPKPMKPTAVKTLAKIPATIDEFIALRDAAKTPEDGVVVVVAAALATSLNGNLGLQMLGLAGHPEASFAYNGKLGPTAKDRLKKLAPNASPQIARSYVLGTSAPDYILPKPPYKINIHNTASTEGGTDLRIFIQSSGSDSWRPIKLRKTSDGLWLISNEGSLAVGIKKK